MTTREEFIVEFGFDPNRGINLLNEKFGKLRVVSYSGLDNRKERVWECECDCGNVVCRNGGSLRIGKTTHCGCELGKKIGESNTTHGQTKTRLYRVWSNMKTRCDNPNYYLTDSYGARGITYCDDWIKFESFMDWSLANGYREELTLDRINTNGNYEPNNCRWTTMSVQQNNRTNNRLITYNGECDTLANWSRKLNIKYNVLQHQLNMGKGLGEIINDY